MNDSTSVCTLCGAKKGDAALLGGANGYVCYSCLGEMFFAVAKSYGKSRGPESVQMQPSANKHCLICDQPVAAGSLVAYRHPFCFCGECLQRAFEMSAFSDPGSLAVVNF